MTASPLREGNTKTHIGRDGWLYLRTALDALAGYGPLRPEPDSVARNPNRKPWRSPLAAITTFAAQLAETDTELLLVPIPVKPMLSPQGLGVGEGVAITHPDAGTFYDELRAIDNVDVFDLAPALRAAAAGGPVFLKQDTHWTPYGLMAATAALALEVRRRGFGGDVEFATASPETRSSPGDLVGNLDLAAALDFGPESVEVRAVSGPTRDPRAPVVLLGDSFTNIYSDAVGLDWGADAGLAEQLASAIGNPLDVIAINGGGATEVREALAGRKGAATLMNDKKLVIWAIAARDLLLSETAAARARVEWGDVVFDTRQPDPPASPDAVPVRVRAELVAKSPIDDPKTTAYTALLYAAEYRLIETLRGEPPETEDGRMLVLHWAFRDRTMLPSAGYEIGERRVMDLVPFDSRADIKALEVSNVSDLFVDLLWEVEREPEGGAALAGAPAGIRPLPAAACAAWAMLLGFGLRRRCHAGLSR